MSGIVIDWVEHNAASRPGALATVELPSGRRQTYAQMHDRVGRIATWLQELGVEKGDRVGLLAINSTDALDIICATWRIGAVHLALNFRLTPGELDYIIGNAEPKVLIHDQELSETVAALTVDIEHLIVTEGQGGESDFETRTAAAESLLRMVEMEPDDQCMLMYSSGTTGQPKGVIMTYGMMVWASINFSALGCNQGMVSLTAMPMFHIGALQVFSFPALYNGGTAVVMRAFEPGATLAALSDKELGVTHFLGVVAIYNALRDHPDNASADFSRMQCALAGAEAIPESLVHWWHKRGLVIQEGYGMTENVASCCVLGKDDVASHVGSAGKPVRHVEVKILREDGSDAEDGESGEICCRGPVVTPGYWRRPEANEESYIDGWFRTGDIGSRDAEGFIYIEDRLKDMYISGGENVYPAEIENILYELEAIREVAVIGVPSEKFGETGCAVVALQEGSTLTEAEILAHCQPRLARFKQPSHVAFVSELPRTATGKVLKFELRNTIET